MRTIGFLLFDNITALDVTGPMEAFASARIEDRDGRMAPCYRLLTIGLRKEPVTAESGLILTPSLDLAECPKLDTLVIPGGAGLREPATLGVVYKWIESRVPETRRIATVCTGIYGLASSGLLDGRRATTHWQFTDDVSKQFPKIKIDANALFVRDGCFYTSAGITAGIDLSLAMIEEDHGRRTALAVARELVVHMKRSGGQEQYSDPLRFQVAATKTLGDVVTYVQAHLGRDLSVGVLAKLACLSERQFSRRFRDDFHMSPAAYVASVRLNESRVRLTETDYSVGQIATSLGFNSDDAFRTAFEKRFGITPTAFRVLCGTGENYTAVL